MQLTELNLSMLHLLKFQKQISLTDMSYQLQINPKKLKYELDKLSEYVAIRHDFIELKIDPFRNGDIHLSDIIFTEKERVDLLLLFLICESGYVSLEHMTSLMNASRNTIINDLKTIRQQVLLLNGKLLYDRTNGYSIQMHHEDKDLLMINLLYQCANKLFFKYFIEQLIPQHDYSKSLRKVQSLENASNITLTDAHRQVVSYAVSILDSGYYKSHDANRFINRLFESHSIIDNPSLINDSFAKTLLSTFVQTFEVACGVVINDKVSFIDKLMIHFYPSVLRAKYKINTTVDAMNLMNESLRPIYTMTKYAIHTIESALNIEYNDNEIALWTLYFGSELRKQGSQIKNHKVACVLCPNGLAVSHALTEKLNAFFPMLNFIQPSSISNVKNIESDVDIIFSTHAVESKRPVYIISQMLDTAELHHLGQKIFNNQMPFQKNYDMNDLIQVIRNHTTIHDEAQLIKEIKSLFKVEHHFKEGYQPMLKELLTESFIQTKIHAEDWQSSIKLASQPLLNAGFITEDYIQAMIETVIDLGPYVVIMPEVAIPHARPEAGALEVGLALATFDEPIQFPNEKIVKLMIVLSAKDQNTHLKALAELTEILGNDSYLETIKQAENKTTILEIINKI